MTTTETQKPKAIKTPMPELPPQPIFSLWHEPWLDVAMVDGSRLQLSFKGLIENAAEVSRIDTPNPLVEAVALRMLIALLMRVESAPLHTADAATWNSWALDVLERGVDAAALAEYGTKYEDRFWLLGGTHPFIQDPRIQQECDKTTSTNKLRIDVQSGNNPLFSTKTPDSEAPVLAHNDAAKALLAQWGYAPGGRCATRSGVSTSVAGSLRAAALYMLEGHNLLETLVLNAVVNQADPAWFGKDACVWEVDPGEALVPGPLGRLTGSSVGMLLFGDEVGVGEFALTWGAVLSAGFVLYDPHVMRRWLVAQPNGDPIPHKLTLKDHAWTAATALTAGFAAQRHERVAVGRKKMFYSPPTVLDPSRVVDAPAELREVFNRSTTSVFAHFSDKATDLGWARASLGPVLQLSSREGRVRRANLRRYLKGVEHITTLFQVNLAQALAAADADKPDWDAAARIIPRLWEQAATTYSGIVSSALTPAITQEALRGLAATATQIFDTATNFSAVGDLRRVRRADRAARSLHNGLKRYMKQETE